MEKNLAVALIQSALHWQDAQANLGHFGRIIASVKKPVDLIVLPEMFTTGFTMDSKSNAVIMDSSIIETMRGWAHAKKAVIAGTLIIKEKKNFYNRMVWVKPDGQIESYDKHHLFRMADEHRYYAAGNMRPVFSINGWKILPIICYDLRFPVWIRNRMTKTNKFEYDVILCPANWPVARNAAWETLLGARAIENSCYSIGVNRVGVDGNGIKYIGNSSVFNFDGTIRAKAPSSKAQVVTSVLSMDELDEHRRRFPVQMDRDEFALLQ